MFYPKWRPGDNLKHYNQRTALAIDHLLKRFGIRDMCFRLLERVHRWPSRVRYALQQDGTSPLWEILGWKSDLRWKCDQDVCSIVDPGNATRWRHVRPGPCRQWETILVDVHGLEW
eukprot:2577746-Karenia_brevis.AAC.1